MVFNGNGEQWQAYCRRLVGLPGFKERNVRSVYLQENKFEFEIDVGREKGEGVVTGLQQERRGMRGGEELPGYEK